MMCAVHAVREPFVCVVTKLKKEGKKTHCIAMRGVFVLGVVVAVYFFCHTHTLGLWAEDKKMHVIKKKKKRKNHHS